MTKEGMSVSEAIRHVDEQFPFAGYIEMLHDGNASIASTVLSHLPRGARVLDFGCGPCDKIAVLQALGYSCAGTDDWQDSWHLVEDNRRKILSFIAQSGVEFAPITNGAPPFARESFDMVMMHDVLEHLHNSPRETLNNLLELVVPGGLFFATVPNATNIRKRLAVLAGRTNMAPFTDYYWSPDPWRGHVREYTKGDLVQLAEALGLEIVELQACNHMLRKLRPALRPLYLAVTSVVPGARDTWLFVGRKRPGWVPRRTLTLEERVRLFGGPRHPATYSPE